MIIKKQWFKLKDEIHKQIIERYHSDDCEDIIKIGLIMDQLDNTHEIENMIEDLNKYRKTS